MIFSILSKIHEIRGHGITRVHYCVWSSPRSKMNLLGFVGIRNAQSCYLSPRCAHLVTCSNFAKSDRFFTANSKKMEWRKSVQMLSNH